MLQGCNLITVLVLSSGKTLQIPCFSPQLYRAFKVIFDVFFGCLWAWSFVISVFFLLVCPSYASPVSYLNQFISFALLLWNVVFFYLSQMFPFTACAFMCLYLSEPLDNNVYSFSYWADFKCFVCCVSIYLPLLASFPASQLMLLIVPALYFTDVVGMV